MKEEKIAKKWRIHEKRAFFLAFFTVLFSFFFCFLPVLSAQTADIPDSARAKAQEARKRASDFEADAYFPSEWEAAEGQYVKAQLMSDLNNSSKTYNEAADSFNRVFELAIPLYAQAREDEIMAIRDRLIELGARNLFREYMLLAEKTALQALDRYEAKDYYPARYAAFYALQKFAFLEKAFDAWLVRQELLEGGFEYYDRGDFDIGNDIIIEAMEAYTDEDLETAQYKAEEALSSFNRALSNAWANYAIQRFSLAEGERLAALDVKADIAAREFFRIADSDNKKAFDLLKSEKYEDAAKLFINAEAMFVIASITTLEKRRSAAAAIKNANDKIRESDRIARNARITNRGGQR
jgi:hypothetical protein